jgi:class 3 adenylate cyclase/tetratricopeptide (TPR) repeat protein
VLFADVAGFSTLAERLDPEAVHDLMDGCFEILTRAVHRYEGTINQYTGDGIMALMGAPIAHEDHAARALHAALDIQANLTIYSARMERRLGTPFRMRIGINSGPVVIGRIGDNLRMDYTAQGDTTNLAARLQQVARPGGIWVGHSTYRMAAVAFDWRAVGRIAVKGREGEVDAYELVGRRQVRSRIEAQADQGLTTFVGRDAELSRMLTSWRATQQGAGQIVSLVGEAGLGKSRLLHEFKRHVSGDGSTCLEGSCFAYGESISYLPFIAVAKQVFGLPAGCSEIEAASRIDRFLLELQLDPAAFMPYLLNLLTYPVTDQTFLRMPGHVVRTHTVEALKVVLTAMARRQPLVLVLEDLHWVDSATEEVLAALVDDVAAVPLLVLLAYRPEYLGAWAEGVSQSKIPLGRLPRTKSADMVSSILSKPHAVELSLPHLSSHESRELASAVLGTATIPADLDRLIATRTDGNPFFIEELTLSLLESGDLMRENGGYHLRAPADALALPATIEGVLLARVDRLADDLREVLQVASVVGRVFGRSLVASIVGEEDLDRRLAQLERFEFIHKLGSPERSEYSFKHVLTQQAVYDAQLQARRRTYHERIGRALEASAGERLEEHYEVLAHHYVRTDNAGKAVEYLRLANGKAIRVNAVAEAKAYFDQAMSLLATLPETEANRRSLVALLVDQDLVFFSLFQLGEYYELLTRHESAAIAIADARLLGALYGRIGHCEWSFGHFDRAIDAASKGVALCEASDNAVDAGMALCLLQWSHLYRGEFDRALSLQRSTLGALEREFQLRWYAWSFGAQSYTYSLMGAWDRAVAEGEREFDAGEQYMDNSVASFAAWNISMAYNYKGDAARATEYAELAERKATTPADKAFARAFLAWAWCRQGEPTRGLSALTEVVGIMRAGRFVPGVNYILMLGEAYWLAGRYDEARSTLEEARDLSRESSMMFYLGSAERLLGETEMASDPSPSALAKAAPHFEESITVLERIKAENELALALAGYGRLQRRGRRDERARECLTRALDIFERLGTLGEPARVRAELGALNT